MQNMHTSVQKYDEISGSHVSEYEGDCLWNVAPCSIAETD
jgi:hypothetical protein